MRRSRLKPQWKTMNKISLESVEKFLERVRVASRTKSKQVVLSTQEAEDISLAIAQLMARNNTLLEEIAGLQRETITAQKGAMDTTIEVDAGSFKEPT